MPLTCIILPSLSCYETTWSSSSREGPGGVTDAGRQTFKSRECRYVLFQLRLSNLTPGRARENPRIGGNVVRVTNSRTFPRSCNALPINRSYKVGLVILPS